MAALFYRLYDVFAYKRTTMFTIKIKSHYLLLGLVGETVTRGPNAFIIFNWKLMKQYLFCICFHFLSSGTPSLDVLHLVKMLMEIVDTGL